MALILQLGFCIGGHGHKRASQIRIFYVAKETEEGLKIMPEAYSLCAGCAQIIDMWREKYGENFEKIKLEEPLEGLDEPQI